MKKLFFILLSLILFVKILCSQTIMYENLYLWYSSDSVSINNFSVDTLYDKSVNNHFAYQPIVASRATIDTNFFEKPSLLFDGSNDYYKLVFSETFNQPITFLVILNLNARIGKQYIFDNYSSSDRQFCYYNSAESRVAAWAGVYGFSGSFQDTLIQLTIVSNGADSHIRRNGVTMWSGNLGANNLDGLTLACANSIAGFYEGNLYDILIYDTVFNDTVLRGIEQSITNRYSPPISLGADKYAPNFCPIELNSSPYYKDYLWSNNDTLASTTVYNTGVYSLTVTDYFGNTSTDEINVYYPTVNIPSSENMVCLGDTLEWDTGLSDDLYDFTWSNGYTTDSIGKYWSNTNAWVTITDTYGCELVTDTIQVIIDDYELTAGFPVADSAMCNGNLLSLVNGADEAVDFLWQDGSTTPEILIETAGTYHLTVTNTLGCTARDTIDVSILGTVPVPNFTVTGFCAEENIQLNDISTSSDGTINAWEWSTNGSPFSTDQNTSISFDTLGIYPVQLEVFTDVGCHHTITQDIEIHPLPAPAFSPITACAMQNVQFDNLSTITQGSLSTSQWQFAAGGEWISADMQAVQHNFDSDGLYDVSLSVMSEAGCEQIISQTVEVRPSPVADFSASAGCVGEAVYFWNQTNAAGTQLWDYAWEFGDGNTATASDPSYTYNTTGYYTIELIAKSLNGCTDTIQKTLTVHNLPVAAVSNLYACLGVPHQPEDITGNEAGNIAAWKWEIDTLEFEIENPVVTMTEAGEYALSLWVESETGCTSQIDTLLYVWENPVASFELPQTWGAVPLALTLENNSEQSETWEWDFGDGETSALETPDHVWQDSGNYTVQLIAISPYGCSDTTALNLRVIIPLVDVAVIAMESKMDGNYLDVTADIINPGTVPISNLGITLDPGNGEIIREVLPEEFAEGAVLRYHFNAQPYFGSGQLPAYVCVSLDPGVPDDQPDNNQLCDMHEAEFTLQAMYPNPVMDMLNLSVLLPQSGDLNVEVYDASGQRVKSLSIDLNSGYHALALDCSDLSSGRYQLRLSFNDQEILKPFVK